MMCPLYVKLFNKVLDTGDIPDDWLVGVIVPIYKNVGEVSDVNNYRGITLLSCLGKLFTTLLNVRLTEFCEENQIIKEIQAGFRQGYSTVDHVFVIKSLIDLFLHRRKKLFCLYIDYRKAFDLVWRDGLWYKLLNAGVDGKIMRVIKNMYSNIKSCVLCNQEYSDYFVSHSGVRQGENLSPMLFSLFVNDIEDHLLDNDCDFIKVGDEWIDTMMKVLVLMYADDTVILAEDERGISNALKAMEAYCDRWKLDINCRKTKVTVFTKRKDYLNNYNFQFKGEKIEIVNEYKYLGVTLNYNGGFKICQEYLCQQGRRAMYSLIAKCRKFSLPVDLQLELFDAMVLPVLTYGCEIWGYTVYKEVESVQLTFFKYILGIRKTTCNLMAYGELGKYPVNVHIKSRILNYWLRLINGKQSKLSFIMYQCLLKMHDENRFRSPWIKYVKSLLDNSGMSGIWHDQNGSNPLWVKLAFERNIKDQWITEWNAKLLNKSSCHSYVSYKDMFVLQSYLVRLSEQERISLCRFRTGNHRLPIVTGRYNSTPRENRYCTKCSENDLGDEYHVLLVCKNQEIVRLRNQFIPMYYRCAPNQFKFVQLLQDSRYKIQNNLAMFARAVLKLF